MNDLAASGSAVIQRNSPFNRPSPHTNLIRRLEDNLMPAKKINRALEILNGTSTHPFTTTLRSLISVLGNFVSGDQLVNVDECCMGKLLLSVQKFRDSSGNPYVVNTGNALDSRKPSILFTHYGVEGDKDYSDASTPTDKMNISTNPCMKKIVAMFRSVARNAGKHCSSEQVHAALFFIDLLPALFEKAHVDAKTEPSRFRRLVCEEPGDDCLLQLLRTVAQVQYRLVETGQRTVVLSLSAPVGEEAFSCGMNAAITSSVEKAEGQMHPEALLRGSMKTLRPSKMLGFDLALITASASVVESSPSIGDLSIFMSGMKSMTLDEIDRTRQEHAEIAKATLEKNHEIGRQLSKWIEVAKEHGADDADMLDQVGEIDTPTQTILRMLKGRLASSDRESVLHDIKRIWGTREEQVEAIKAVDDDRGTIMKLYLQDIASSDREAVLREIKRIFDSHEKRVEAIEAVDNDRRTIMKLYLRDIASSDREAVLREIKRIFDSPEERVRAIKAVDNDRGTIMKLYLNQDSSTTRVAAIVATMSNTTKAVQDVLEGNPGADMATLFAEVKALDDQARQVRDRVMGNPHMDLFKRHIGFYNAPSAHMDNLVEIEAEVRALNPVGGGPPPVAEVAQLLLKLKTKDGAMLYNQETTLIRGLTYFHGRLLDQEFKTATCKVRSSTNGFLQEGCTRVFGVANTCWTIQPRSSNVADEAKTQFIKETALLNYLLARVITGAEEEFAVALITAVLCRGEMD